MSDLGIAVIGFGNFGKFISETFVKYGRVYAVDRDDKSTDATMIKCQSFTSIHSESVASIPCNVIVLSVSIVSFEEVIKMLPRDLLRGKLIVDVCSVKSHAKAVMLANLPEDCDIICTHPMFGPESGKYGWQGLSFVYDKVRVSDTERADRFLHIWESERCKMIEMTCEQHDEYAASSQFITHLTGRILWQQNLVPTPIDTKGFEALMSIRDNVCKDSFDLFSGLYRFNRTNADKQIHAMRKALDEVQDLLMRE